jgi:hypothetical protein
MMPPLTEIWGTSGALTRFCPVVWPVLDYRHGVTIFFGIAAFDSDAADGQERRPDEHLIFR